MTDGPGCARVGGDMGDPGRRQRAKRFLKCIACAWIFFYSAALFALCCVLAEQGAGPMWAPLIWLVVGVLACRSMAREQDSSPGRRRPRR